MAPTEQNTEGTKASLVINGIDSAGSTDGISFTGSAEAYDESKIFGFANNILKFNSSDNNKYATLEMSSLISTMHTAKEESKTLTFTYNENKITVGLSS